MMHTPQHAHTPIEVFYSNAQADEPFCKELEKHLSLLRQQGIITEWHHRKIVAGTNWQHAIDAHLTTASVILLLISADYLASDYCYSTEMQRALARHATGDACVIPVLLRPVDWQGAPFAHIQCVPRNEKPITSWSNRDEAFRDVARAIREAIEHLCASPRSISPAPASPVIVGDSTSTYSTCFISHAPLDQAFAEQLHADLLLHGVPCWFAPEDMRIGDKKRVRVEQAIRDYDKLLLVLSQDAVKSDWVEYEVETAFEKEDRDKTLVLFPIRLDETVMKSATGWAAHIRRTRHIGDFPHWTQPDAYQKALSRLLRDLKRNA
jgi:hypothetical protein